MTGDRMALQTLLEKASDAELLRQMTRVSKACSCLREAGASLRRRQVGYAAERLIALQAEGICGAGHDPAYPMLHLIRAAPNPGSQLEPLAHLERLLRWNQRLAADHRR